MKAMILAAGRGERMRPLTDHTPKPLLKVGGKPLIVWHLERLAAAGFKDIVINHAHLGHMIEAALGNGAQWGLSIQYSPEKVALETAGGIANALHLLTENGTKGEPFLVVNGDTFTDFDFAALAHLPAPSPFKAEGGGEGKIVQNLVQLVLIDNPPQHPNGDFAIEFKSQSDGMLKNSGKQMLTFSGVGVYHPDLFDAVVIGQPAKLAPLIRKAIENNAATAQYYQGVWHDIGTSERLKKLDNDLKITWWKKTVEYTFVRHILTDNSIAAPLAGKPEKWTSDLIEQIEDEFRLIEFKRDKESIKKEDDKYEEKTYFESCKNLVKLDGAKSHWLIYGEASDDNKLQLKYRNYLQIETESSDLLLIKSADLTSLKFSIFVEYVDALMQLRGNKEGGLSGLVLAGVGNNQTTVMDLTEFIQIRPELAAKLESAPAASHAQNLSM